MNNEMRQPEDLARERQALESKVAGIQAKKNEDIARRIAEMDKRRDETRGLTSLLGEAEQNVQYYKKLEESGQLPEDERENMATAEELVSQIKAKMAEHNEVIKKDMAIPEVLNKVRDEAGAENEERDKEKAKSQKEKIMEEKYFQWFKKLADKAGELDKKQSELFANYDAAAENLKNKINALISDSQAKERLNKIVGYAQTEIDKFEIALDKYRKGLGITKFFEKKSVDLLVNSGELNEMKKAVEELNRFIEENNLKGWTFNNYRKCVWASLCANTGGITDELKKLVGFSYEEPALYSDREFKKAYERVGSIKDTGVSADDIFRQAK